jgi:hypothetical protein
MESGIVLHWKKESVSAEVKTLKEQINYGITDFNISIHQLQSAFYLNISAIFISIILLILEILSLAIKYKYSTKNSIFC